MIERAVRHTRDHGISSTIRVASRPVYARILDAAPRSSMAIIRAHCRLNPHRTDADPFKILWIDPFEITRSRHRYPSGWGFVERTPLKEPEPIEGRPPFPEIDRFVNTGDAGGLRTVFERDTNVLGYPRHSNGGVEDRIQEVRELANTIAIDGYRTQRELLEEAEATHERAANDPVPARLNEIIVDIDADGEFLWRACGQTRLAIARALDLDRVAILVASRHIDWQTIRDSVRTARGPGTVPPADRRHLDHPDLDDLRV